MKAHCSAVSLWPCLLLIGFNAEIKTLHNCCRSSAIGLVSGGVLLQESAVLSLHPQCRLVAECRTDVAIESDLHNPFACSLVQTAPSANRSPWLANKRMLLTGRNKLPKLARLSRKHCANVLICVLYRRFQYCFLDFTHLNRELAVWRDCFDETNKHKRISTRNHLVTRF